MTHWMWPIESPFLPPPAYQPSDPHLNYNKTLFGRPPQEEPAEGGKFKPIEIGKYILFPIIWFPIFPTFLFNFSQTTLSIT